jgi:hypothetical protein
MPVSKGKPLLLSHLFEPRHDLAKIYGTAFKKLFQGKALFRRVGMEGKSGPTDINLIILSKSFDTPGNEVTPRSNII